MSAFNSMAGSPISVIADIRMSREQLVSDIAAARQTIQTEFSSMQINFGASLLESVRSVAPEISATIAQAVAAGMAGGSGGGFPGTPGTGTPAWPNGPPASLGDSIDEDAPIAVGVTATAVAEDAAGAAIPASIWRSTLRGTSGASGLGMGSMARLFSAFMVLRAARSGEEFFEKSAADDESVFEAENMPGHTDRQRVSRDEAELRAYKEKRNEIEGFWGLARDAWQQGGPIQGYKQYLQQSNLLTAEIGTTQTDLSAAKANENQEDEKRLELENQIIEARRRGNTAEAEHLQLLEQLTQRMNQMNDNPLTPGAGTAWFNTTGQAILDDQTAEGIITKMDNATIRQMGFQKSLDILNKAASGDVRGAERERIQWQQQHEYMKVEENFDIVSKQVAAQPGADRYNAALKIMNDPDYPEPTRDAARAVVEQKQLMDATLKAYDAGHSGMAFTSGMETWRRMQSAGYGSAPGDNSNARRVYAAGGGGASAAGGLIGSTSPLVHASTIHGFDGTNAIHPIGSGIGFAGFHPDLTHRMMEHNDLSGHRATSEKSGGGGIMGLIDKLNTKLDNAPKLAVVKISG
jgi:hypothetical protein